MVKRKTERAQLTRQRPVPNAAQAPPSWSASVALGQLPERARAPLQPEARCFARPSCPRTALSRDLLSPRLSSWVPRTLGTLLPRCVASWERPGHVAAPKGPSPRGAGAPPGSQLHRLLPPRGAPAGPPPRPRARAPGVRPQRLGEQAAHDPRGPAAGASGPRGPPVGFRLPAAVGPRLPTCTCQGPAPRR